VQRRGERETRRRRGEKIVLVLVLVLVLDIFSYESKLPRAEMRRREDRIADVRLCGFVVTLLQYSSTPVFIAGCDTRPTTKRYANER
jgi:hypothetical protein